MPHPDRSAEAPAASTSDHTQRALAALLRISDVAASAADREGVLCGTVAAIAEGLSYDRVALYFRSGAASELEGVMGVGCAAPLTRLTFNLATHRGPESQAVLKGRVVTSSEGSTLGPGAVFVPVWSGERVMGALGADRSFRGEPITPQDVEMLKVFANQVGIAVENRELHRANERKIQELVGLQRISREMTSTLDNERLLGMVAEEAIRRTGAEGALLYLLEPGGEGLRLQAWAGGRPPPGRERISLGYGIAGWVARSGNPLRVADRGAQGGETGGFARKSQLAVPLLSEGQVVGVLAVEGRQPEGFSATDEELLALFAAQAAKAIEAARFFQEIRQERDLREKILEGSPNGVVALDGTRKVVLMNQSARRCLGAADEPRGNPIERYLAHPDFSEALRKVLEQGSPLENVEFTLKPGGRARYLLVSIFALGAQEAPGATLIVQDLTERRRLDERVQRMARLASIGQLAAGIAHEIRNPLTGVSISLDILREEEGLSGEGRSLLDDINREVDRLEALIRGLLDFARPQPVQRRPMRVAKALEWHRTFGEQCRKKGIHCEVDVQANPKVEGDPEKLKQLFLNLALNALDATGPGGEIRIGTEQVRDDSGGWVRVSVEDTGRGMTPETVEQIFNPFFTTKNEGTGLGLSIAHSIVEQHGGRIDVHSTPQVGTRFVVDLRAADEEA